MTDKTPTKYIVYWDDEDGVGRFEDHPDLATARAAASNFAKYYLGQKFHIAAHVTTFGSETVVKETAA